MPERVERWRAIPRLVHGFYGRAGGRSGVPRDSLNLSYKVGDAPGAVAANWAALAETLGGLAVARMDQVHGTAIAEVSGQDDPARRKLANASVGEADGLATRDCGVGLAVMTADCVPILMVAPEERATMALHAGWRGTVAGIAAAGLAHAAASFGIAADRWEVALGPAIGGCCYEVDAEIGDRLESVWGSMPDAWSPATSAGQLFLDRANANILAAQGVPRDNIHFVGSCTACNPQKYFSHRQSGGKTGRQASIIGFV